MTLCSADKTTLVINLGIEYNQIRTRETSANVVGRTDVRRCVVKRSKKCQSTMKTKRQSGRKQYVIKDICCYSWMMKVIVDFTASQSNPWSLLLANVPYHCIIHHVVTIHHRYFPSSYHTYVCSRWRATTMNLVSPKTTESWNKLDTCDSSDTSVRHVSKQDYK